AADLAIGIPGKDFFQCLSGCEGVNTFADAGAVRVIYGGSSGLSVDNRLLNAVGPSQLWTQDAPSGTGGIGFTVPGQLESGDRFGSAVY
ncbi:MAG TPA: hypothetical protein VN428_27120, partial [Bryobacteraceae bacterium]|nr:hypothetical protein [Bryobacteraceae bacterium]